MQTLTESGPYADVMSKTMTERNLSAAAEYTQHEYRPATDDNSNTCFRKFLNLALGWCRGRHVTVSSVASENQLHVCMHWTLPHGDHESFERLHSAVTYPSESKRHQTKQPGATRTSITYSTADMQSDDTLGKMQIFAPASVYAKPLSSHELQIQLREEIARDLARYCSLMCDELPSKCAPQRPSKKHLSSDSFKHASHAELAHSLSGTVRRPPVTASKASGGHSCAVLAHRRMTISQTPIYPQKSNPAILAGSRSMDRKRTF